MGGKALVPACQRSVIQFSLYTYYTRRLLGHTVEGMQELYKFLKVQSNLYQYYPEKKYIFSEITFLDHDCVSDLREKKTDTTIKK